MYSESFGDVSVLAIHMKRLFSLYILLVLPSSIFAQHSVRTWKAVGGYETRAAFVAYEGGRVSLRKEDGEEVSVPIGKLDPSERAEVIRLSKLQLPDPMPKGPIEKPSGRREITWEELTGPAPWPKLLDPDQLETLQAVGRSWEHAQSRFFILHYQSLGYAKKVSRMADFQYQFIAADLPGFHDRLPNKSHITVIRNRGEWLQFLTSSGAFPTWAAAFVRGDMMFLYDMDDRETNAEILTHEMSHLVLNRFFLIQPPLWLNEGLAEWYGNTGYRTFKGLKVDPEENMGSLADPIPLETLFGMSTYPEGDGEISRFYATSKQVVGMLMLRKSQPEFVKFLEGITVKGIDVDQALEEVYGFGSVQEVQVAFREFLR